MKNWVYALVAGLMGVLLAGCAVPPQENEDRNTALFPQNSDEAAQFLVTAPNEQWVLMVADDGSGNKIYANKGRVALRSDGISTIWMRMVFSAPMRLSQNSTEAVTGSLIYAEVRCQDNMFRPSVFYAVGTTGQILDVVTHERTDFAPMNTSAMALGLYRIACESK